MTSPGRYAKGEAKRREILEVALELIARNGYRRSTLREIAGAVGLTNAGVLHYFGSREELFAEVLRLRDSVGSETMAEGDALDQLLHVIAGNQSVPGLVHLYASLSAEAVDADHAAHEFFAARYETLRRHLADALGTAVADGRLRRDLDPERAARILIAVADGLQTQWLIDPTIDMADHVAHLVELWRA